MAIAQMQKVSIVGHNKDEGKIVRYLHDAGFVEVSSWKKKDETTKVNAQEMEAEASKLASRMADIKFSIELLRGYEETTRRQRLERLLSPKIEITSRTIQDVEGDSGLMEIVREIGELDQELRELEAQRGQLSERKELLGQWDDLNITLTDEMGTRSSMVAFGTIEELGYLEFVRALDKKVSGVEIRKVNAQDKVNYLLVVFLKDRQKEAQRVFLEHNFKMVELPSVGKTPSQYLDKASAQIDDIGSRIAALEKKLRKLANRHLERLKVAYDITAWKDRQVGIQRGFAKTKNAFSLVGWIKKRDFERLKQGLGGITSDVELIKLEPLSGEPVPIAIENSAIVRPFESITTLYGLPRASEVDPTPFLALFFIVFFALCLTDAGYGLLLVALSYLALKVLKLAEGARKLIRLLMFGGFITIAIGALTGGWFGIVLADLPAGLSFVSGPLIWIQQVDPIKDPMKILILSLVLGYLHLWFGLGIDLWWKLKARKRRDAILGTGPWLIFFSAIAFYAMAATGILPSFLADAGKYCVWASLALMVLTQGYNQKGIFKKAFFGVGSLYSIIGYVSDLLSYSRLLALGLTTAVIAMVINIIALLLRDMVPYVGWILMILVLVGGHLFNLIINVLGAFIHSGRLQFVEFFPKFFEGGGKKFEPFSRQSKYVTFKRL